ncbi:5'-methylthioadenosine/S-adenosylhomocysteine nucleosidase [Candidatus Poribacteria bacterium]|nr:5'-methylthioadenosine/S-adenosylhomocysteine nucleosidase [Candidatus Poribacteria bacterium]
MHGVKFVSTKLCIMTAYADETLALLNVLGQDVGGSVDWNSRLYFEWTDGDKKWVVMQSGMGKVRAASMFQMIIDTYQVDTFFEFGFAGGLIDTLNIGDVVVITGVSEHDVPNRPEIQREQDTWRAHLFHASASSISRFSAALSANPGVTLTKASVICGDMDIYDREVRDRIAEESGAVAVNWESSAIVDVCAINNVKYVGIRIISDLCVAEDSGPIPKARVERLHKSTKAYVNALADFNKGREILSDAV